MWLSDLVVGALVADVDSARKIHDLGITIALVGGAKGSAQAPAKASREVVASLRWVVYMTGVDCVPDDPWARGAW